MSRLKLVARICVFCGSSPGTRPEYVQAAKQLAYVLTDRNIGLVYGGARVGVMGEIAKAFLEVNGGVIGVMPKELEVYQPPKGDKASWILQMRIKSNNYAFIL